MEGSPQFLDVFSRNRRDSGCRRGSGVYRGLLPGNRVHVYQRQTQLRQVDGLDGRPAGDDLAIAPREGPEIPANPQLVDALAQFDDVQSLDHRGAGHEGIVREGANRRSVSEC